jgi:hypothetical protein
MKLGDMSELAKLNNIMSSSAAALASVSVDRHKLNPAEWAYDRLVEYIKDFEKDLDDEHEIGARLVSFGSVVTFHIQNIGYYGPDMINFDGQDEQGQRVQLIQHLSQLNVLLIAMKKIHEKPRRLGFILSHDKNDEGE